MDDQLVTLRTYSHPWQAELARTVLEAEGLTAFVADANTVTMNWLWSNAIGGVRLQVPMSSVQEATKVLAFEEPTPEYSIDQSYAPVCPQCGKNNLTVIRLGRRWTFLTWILVGIPLFFPPKRFQCLECGAIWK